MSRLLTREEIEALRASGPAAMEPAARLSVGDSVEILVDGLTLAHGRVFSHAGRVCVRVERLVTRPDDMIPPPGPEERRR